MKWASRVFPQILLKATGQRAISSDQFPILMVWIREGAVQQAYIFYFTDIPHYDESLVLDRLQLPTSIRGRLRSLITVSAALDPQINHRWYPKAKLQLSITVNNLLLKTAECTYEMCWQTGRNNRGGKTILLVFFGIPLSVLMKFSQL